MSRTMILLLIVLILAAAVLLIAAVLFCIAFRSPDRRLNDDRCIPRSEQTDPIREELLGMIDALNTVPYERVSIPSGDGLRLAGRYYPHDGAPLILAFHGYRGTPSRDFSGGARFYLDEGYALLLPEQRAHVGSEGHVVTLGVKERFDCLSWIGYARERFGPDRPIVLAGISMGAATVLMASGLGLPENVKGILADAPFTSPAAILAKVCGDVRVPAALALPFLRLAARLYGGFGLSDADAAEAVTRTPVPILLIHGEDDRFVPCDMGRQIAAANPEKITLETFPGAGHGLSFVVDRPRYERLVRDFLARVLAEETRST